ncbi:MAG TPA: glycine cleavage T C-terminal barrel domain-containing protein, partial [Pseudomonadales bacterium]
DGAVLFNANGQHVGTVSSGGFAPSLNKPVALAYVEQPLVVGDTVYADVRGKKLPMDVASLPFVPHRYCRG